MKLEEMSDIRLLFYFMLAHGDEIKRLENIISLRERKIDLLERKIDLLERKIDLLKE